MSLSRNFIAGLTNSVWSALLGLAVVPTYIRFLGIESYGLIGFFVTTQTLLQLLDMGLAPTINREVARCSASGKLKEAGNLLHTLSVVYWSMALLIALLTAALAPLIADHWIQAKQLTQDNVEHAVMLMGLVIACRWPIGLYQGALVGAQRLTVSSGINMLMATIGSLGAIAILAFVSPTIQAFFIWQASVGIVYAATMRWAAWRVIGRSRETKFDVNQLKSIWRFSAGMTGITLMGLVFSQMDKVLLSKFLSLGEFAHYMLATTIVSALYVLVGATYNTIYPRFSALIVGGNLEELGKLYRLSTRLLAIVLFPSAMILAVFAKDLVQIWTGNLGMAETVAPILAFLAIGSALNGIMYIPHAMLLAFGMTKLPLIINGILMIVQLPLIVILALKYGALGGALAWFTLHILYVLLGTWLTHKHVYIGLAKKWLFNDVGVPLGLSISGGLLAQYLCQSGELSTYVQLAIGAGIALSVVVVSLLLTPQLRLYVIRHLGGKEAANIRQI
ncbi:colanic acid exporter [mine drainage metagenome]|uniref:Colanic acid exporter n=1 Tax=mine drainage metagenome TaxID=410659 RepID=A0A1J5S6P5_9ZZZZ